MTNAAEQLPAVIVEGVSKEFKLPHERYDTLKERALHPFRRRSSERLQAVQNVSFAIDRGEFFGIVGRNGSGKSTLLKCMAGIYRLDAGQIQVNGRLSTFIELGVGFNPDLAARDNVTLNGIMLGLSPAEAKRRFERVIEFAELEEFVDLKLKNYSSGMTVRLAFSVMIQVDADILLIDEVLAVGDVAFQQKCFDQFHRLREAGRTIVLVTHDMRAVQHFCHRALLLERGRVVLQGDPGDVSAKYMDVNFATSGEPAPRASGSSEDSGVSIGDAWFENERGERTGHLHQGRTCSFKVLYEFADTIESPNLGVVFQDEREIIVFGTSAYWTGQKMPTFSAGDRCTLKVEFDNPLSSGRYFATPFAARRGTTGDFYDRRDKVATVVVTSDVETGAIVQLPHDLTVTREGAEVQVP